MSLATAYGSNLTVSGLTNALPAVATSTSHGLSDGDFVEVTSGWSRLNARIVRIDGSTTNTVEFEGIDTSSVVAYPSGSGTGSMREISTFTQITQLIDAQTSGGEMQFVTYSFLENDYETQLPTQSSPQTLTLTIADDATQAGYIALKAAAEARAVRALKISYPGGAVAVYNGYVSFNETPSLSKNNIMAVTATFNLLSRPVRYAA